VARVVDVEACCGGVYFGEEVHGDNIVISRGMRDYPEPSSRVKP
jgi:hypothetical protein